MLFHIVSARVNRLTNAGVVVADEPRSDALWVMWIGKRHWEGLPGEFDVGQTGWVYPRSKPAGVFMFFPAFSSESAWSYQVPCVVADFLRFTSRENG